MTPVAPALISPRRTVPDGIERPEYVDRPQPERFTGSEVKDADTIERIRIASRLAARAREAVGEAVQPGVTTDELDRIGHEFLCDHGAYPSTLGYKNFPKSLCSSVNEVICHGIPDSRVVEDGDIVNIDITAFINGVHGDTNATFLAGDVDEESRLLVERTHEALMRGINAVKPGRRLNVIGRVIESYAKRFGYGVVRDFTGHGIGTSFHSGLIVPHYDTPLYDDEIQVGMTFTIEPMLNLGTHEWVMWDDGWTVVTRDGRRSAQFEHTLLVTPTGTEILTNRLDGDEGVERLLGDRTPPHDRLVEAHDHVEVGLPGVARDVPAVALLALARRLGEGHLAVQRLLELGDVHAGGDVLVLALAHAGPVVGSHRRRRPTRRRTTRGTACPLAGSLPAHGLGGGSRPWFLHAWARDRALLSQGTSAFRRARYDMAEPFALVQTGYAEPGACLMFVHCTNMSFGLR